jgi:hypothetical protein
MNDTWELVDFDVEEGQVNTKTPPLQKTARMGHAPAESS